MYPTDAIISGKKIPMRELVGASIEIKVTNVEIDKNNPTKATNCLRLISPLPILQLPGMYWISDIF
jgi:hypothetical protein